MLSSLRLVRAMAVAAMAVLVMAVMAVLVPGTPSVAVETPSPVPSTASPEATETAEAAVSPETGDCWAYGFRAAVAATGTVPVQRPVPCGSDHTATTLAVGGLAAYADGHLLALDAPAVQADAARSCEATFDDRVGGTERTRSLTLLRPVWVLPSFEAYLEGASWFRCDVVLLGREGRLAPLPGGIRGALDGAAVPPRRVGRCSTGVPGAERSREVVCSRAHRWRAVAAVPVAPAGARGEQASYPGRGAVAATTRTACERVAQREQGTVRFRYSAQFPSRGEWNDGRRLGTCWLPSR
ncbi:septum formation family protein [Nocardioidaceae bacterium]|nr:septum formation family protein [Nocardioidaceae bacterium]